MNPLQWLEQEVFGNSLLTWAITGGLFVVAWLALLLSKRVLRNRSHALSRRHGKPALEIAEQVIGRTSGVFLLLLALYLGSHVLSMPESVEDNIHSALMVIVFLQAGIWGTAALVSFIQAKRRRELESNPDAVAAMDVLSFLARVAVWSIVLLVLIDNLGYDVTTLVAGLGIGGIAVALAAQNVLGDLFASLSIVLDKPFSVGDFLIIGDFLGSVEKVGVKTTRLRSLSGEQLVFSNNDLLGSRIRNYGRMFERRILFSLGVTYQTPAEKLERIPVLVREAVEEQESVRFDRAHFRSYGDFALIFEIVYYVLSADYNRYMDLQQAINLTIYRRFEDEGIEFAYPTQTLYLTRARPES